MEIEYKNIKAAYETATESEKRLLSNLFPNLSLDKSDNVTERIKTLTDAMLELGGGHPFVDEYHLHICQDMSPDLRAYLQLRVICAALNEGWEPQFTENEKRWYPWYNLLKESELNDEEDYYPISDCYKSEYRGLVYEYSVSVPPNAAGRLGSRLCLKTEELAEYCGKQFIHLWADYLLTPKTCRHD